MDAAYLDRLAPDVQALVSEVEVASGIEIAVEIDSSRSGRGPDGAGVLACDITENGATLLVPSDDYFPDGGVVHELLHMRRILVEHVPKLVVNLNHAGWSPEFENAISHLDNDLEHWIIVPEEIRRCPERHERWEQILEKIWIKDVPGTANKFDQRCLALTSWAFLSFALPQSALLPTAESELNRLGLEQSANDFTTATRAQLNCKEDLVRIVFEHLQIPIERAALEYICITDHEAKIALLH